MASALVKTAVATVLTGWDSSVAAVVQPNEAYTPSGAPFIAIEYPGASVERFDIGAPEAPMWLEAGALMVHTFVPLGAGEDIATAIADAVWELFRGQDVAGCRFDSRLSGQSGERAFPNAGPYWGVSFGIAFRLQAVSA